MHAVRVCALVCKMGCFCEVITKVDGMNLSHTFDTTHINISCKSTCVEVVTNVLIL
jgi:hypothetical protein